MNRDNILETRMKKHRNKHDRQNHKEKSPQYIPGERSEFI